MMCFPASTKLLNWLTGTSGCLTAINRDYGTVAEMLEHPDWDEAKTEFVINYIASVTSHLASLEKEIRNHVEKKRF